MSRVVVCGFSVNVRTHLDPRVAVPYVNADVTRVGAVAVVAVRADRNDVAVRRQGHRISRVVVRGFAIDVGTLLLPRAAVSLIDADMPGTVSVPAVLVCTDCEGRAVR